MQKQVLMRWDHTLPTVNTRNRHTKPGVCPPPASMATHEGWLCKRGQLNSAFRARWFVLEGDVLSYHTGPQAKAKGSILLTAAAQVEASGQHARQFHVLAASGRRYVLEAPSEEAAHGWLRTLQSVVRPDSVASAATAISSTTDGATTAAAAAIWKWRQLVKGRGAPQCTTF